MQRDFALVCEFDVGDGALVFIEHLLRVIVYVAICESGLLLCERVGADRMP